MSVHMFPGQGAQTKGMGKDIFSRYPDYVKQANDLLGYDIEELCLEDPNSQLSQTQYTQPALFTLSSLMYLSMIESSPKPDFLIGHSVGEYTALFAAGVFDFLTGLSLVKERGRLMSQVEGGGMLAVIGLPINEIEKQLKAHDFSQVDIANYNTPEQIVISGTKKDIQAVEPILSKTAKMCIPLTVSGAFHSHYMQKSADEFAKYLQSHKFSSPKIPVIANLTAKPYEPNEISSNLINQISHRVKWCESIWYLMDHGEQDFKQVGPGRVLTGMIPAIQAGKL